MHLVAAGVITLRCVASAVALWNISWSASGVYDLSRGQVRPPAIYLSVVFWMSTAVLAFQGGYLAHRPVIWQLFCYSLLTTAMGVAAFGNRLGDKLKTRQLFAMYDHLDIALAVTDLARVDGDAAARMAAEARKLTVAVIGSRNG